MKLARKRKCKAFQDGIRCNKEFRPTHQQQQWCSDECQEYFIKKANNKVQEANRRKWEKQQKELRKAERKATRLKKQSLETRYTILNKAQKAVNAYGRERDKSEPCINCGLPVDSDGNNSDAAHDFSRGGHSSMRFDLRNIHKSCKKCNKYQEKWIHKYRENLIRKIGLKQFEKLDADRRYYDTHQRKFSKEYLRRIERIFKQKKRRLIKQREHK